VRTLRANFRRARQRLHDALHAHEARALDQHCFAARQGRLERRAGHEPRVLAKEELGGLLFQFPPYVIPKEASFDYLAWAREQLEDDQMLVEFRHRSWYEDEQREETLRFLEEHRMSHVVVDAPRSEGKNVPLTVQALTTPILYVRMHGRNAETWNVRGRSAAERFDYLYPEEELTEWVDPLKELSQQAEEAYVLLNNNNRVDTDIYKVGLLSTGADLYLDGARFVSNSARVQGKRTGRESSEVEASPRVRHSAPACHARVDHRRCRHIRHAGDRGGGVPVIGINRPALMSLGSVPGA